MRVRELICGGVIGLGVGTFAPPARADDATAAADAPADETKGTLAPEPGIQPPPSTGPVGSAPPPAQQPDNVGGGRVPWTVAGKISLRPHRAIVTLGATIFTLAYAPAAVVGVTSDRDSDRALLAPFAGPWLALAQRDCAAQPCGSNDDVAKAFTLASGFAQAGGLAIVIWGLVVPEIIETRIETTPPPSSSSPASSSSSPSSPSASSSPSSRSSPSRSSKPPISFVVTPFTSRDAAGLAAAAVF